MYAPTLFFRAPDEPILDLGVDLMEPLFRTVGSFLMKPNFGLQFGNPIFGRAKLMRKSLRHIERMLAVRLSHSSGFVKQPQNRLPSRVSLVRVICTATSRRWRERDYRI